MDSATSPYADLDPNAQAFVVRVLASARDYLGARVSFLAELTGADKFIRAADGDAAGSGLPVGMRFDVEDSYCYQLLNGRIPEAIYDARVNPLTCDIPLTRILGIDSYMGVPVVLGDGRIFGTLCCVNFEPNPESCARDVGFMRFLADLLGHQLENPVQASERLGQRRSLLTAIIAAGGPTMVFQPVVSLANGRMDGVEALARVDATTPQALFREAWQVGMGPRMELAAIAGALWALDCLPEHAFLSLNVSPGTLVLPEFSTALRGRPADRIVLEITEHAPVDDYDVLARALSELRQRGMRVAIDDVGAGYSSLQHVLRIGPDIIKLDISLVAGIENDLAKQAMVAGVMAFAGRTGTQVIAEGVETQAQARVLEAAGVPHAQGFLFTTPGPLAPLIERG
ncbi:sensor domain-containing phosphodiesterase [Lysobacter xanthus]